MRARRLAAMAVLLSAAPAAAEIADEIAVARAEGRVLTDGKGHYIVFAAADPQKFQDDIPRGVWYGDARTVHKVGVNYGHGNGEARWRIVDPRTGSIQQYSMLLISRDGATMQCDERITKLSIVPDEQARALTKKLAFKPPLNQRMPLALGREGTTYYFIDHPIEMTEKTKHKTRVFIGKRGAMKEQKTTRVDVDNSGTVVTTPKGALHTTRVVRSDIAPPGGHSLTWRPAKGEPLTLVDIDTEVNSKLIFAELGIYPARLGKPCDDL